MNIEFKKKSEIPKTKGRGVRPNELVNTVLEFIETDNECMVVHFDNRNEVNTAYQTLYAYTKRRHQLPIKTSRRANDLWIWRE